ncbi:hypothetical protein V6N12_029033 [Hibiscus sabdariffa]|uniref:Uncharacterized protein n=1 Tax=Hibiscus sabdariffa TaxID=183260 RepID=A0ABR2F7P1_9ROSI
MWVRFLYLGLKEFKRCPMMAQKSVLGTHTRKPCDESLRALQCIRKSRSFSARTAKAQEETMKELSTFGNFKVFSCAFAEFAARSDQPRHTIGASTRRSNRSNLVGVVLKQFQTKDSKSTQAVE